jgi:hypothetical protein
VNVTSSFHPAWLAAAGLTLLVGLLLLLRGWRGRRVGEEPHCARCKYNLFGLERTRCPECGADVSAAKSVLIGQRVRRQKAITTGATLSVIAATFLSVTGWHTLRHFDWYTLKPTGYVLDDLEPATSLNRTRAWQEIQRRLSGGGKLADRHHTRLIELALAEQTTVSANGPVPILTDQLVQWVDREAQAGKLNEKQRATLCEQSQFIMLTVRPSVVAGERIPYTLTRRVYGFPDPFYVRITDVSATIDGAPQRGEVSDTAKYRLTHNSSPIPPNYPRSFEPAESVGAHEIAVKAHVEIWSVPAPGGKGGTTFVHGFDVVRKATVQVVSPEGGHR